MLLIPQKSVVTLEVLYFWLDYPSLLQSFVWSTDDYIPEIPRVHKFLKFWRQEIPAVINQVNVCWGHTKTWQKVDFEHVH